MPVEKSSVVVTLVALITIALTFFWWVTHRRKTRGAVAAWAGRRMIDDEAFLDACGIPREPLRAEVALAARRVIARLGTVPAETVRPDYSIDHDLGQLPFWNSLDWLAYIFEVELELHGEIKLLSTELMYEAFALAVGGQELVLRVEHVVRATSLAAIRRPGRDELDAAVDPLKA